VATATRPPVNATPTTVAAARRDLPTLRTVSPFEHVTVHQAVVRDVGFMRAVFGCTAKRSPVAAGDHRPARDVRPRRDARHALPELFAHRDTHSPHGPKAHVHEGFRPARRMGMPHDAALDGQTLDAGASAMASSVGTPVGRSHVRALKRSCPPDRRRSTGAGPA
jgi:hypothetical protein